MASGLGTRSLSGTDCKFGSVTRTLTWQKLHFQLDLRVRVSSASLARCPTQTSTQGRRPVAPTIAPSSGLLGPAEPWVGTLVCWEGSWRTYLWAEWKVT